MTSGFVAQTELLTAVTHGTDQQSCTLTVLDCSSNKWILTCTGINPCISGTCDTLNWFVKINWAYWQYWFIYWEGVMPETDTCQDSCKINLELKYSFSRSILRQTRK